MRLKGMNCVVTGGSSGIGAATVRRFVAEGAEVLIADIAIDNAEALADELGEPVSAIKCDVRVESDVQAVAEAAYGSAKGGMVVFTRDMAIELASTGVRFNCVCPGVIETPMMERWTDLMPDKEAVKTMLKGVMPIGRMGTADEVAGAIFFFASTDSSLCQGATLSVDGGFTAQ